MTRRSDCPSSVTRTTLEIGFRWSSCDINGGRIVLRSGCSRVPPTGSERRRALKPVRRVVGTDHDPAARIERDADQRRPGKRKLGFVVRRQSIQSAHAGERFDHEQIAARPESNPLGPAEPRISNRDMPVAIDPEYRVVGRQRRRRDVEGLVRAERQMKGRDARRQRREHRRLP
jgi:hypothetical protein